MKKRLLLISSNSSGRGGGERYLVYLTQGLRLLDCEVHVLLSTVNYMDTWAKALDAEGAQVHRRDLSGLRVRPLRFVQAIADKKQQQKVASVCKEIHPDAILVNQQYDEDGLDYITGALNADIATVGGVMHMPMTATKNQRPFGKQRGNLLRKWYIQHPYRLLFVSKGSLAEFRNYYNLPYPDNLVHHGCPFLEIGNEPDLSKFPYPLSTIGFIGQFVPQKNLQLLVEGWLWMRKQGIETRLLLVGDGSERNSIEKLLAAAPQETWHITGWQNHPEKYLSIIDIYAMTSHFEGLPLALLEAVGRGLPAVVTNFNGAVDVAEHTSWVKVVTKSDPVSVGKALADTIQNLSNLKKQAQDNQETFRRYFSPSRMAKDTLAALGIA
ncbi:glycosyltransferase family 4 protein [Iningainema tapete]|uniref:Glycosyltransferase family 4 protein n=1 Tax=Iningainema tapete BLCC-T55 TaxID=2748662 RepID=A0A8J7C6T5_9CYAN|nr:glycosyltransferase family 4 protein [Iningainema tapete]MBD2772381.1 glycosyltransferase family 4 protein [Iningainema tapete BLCC-T55]